MSTTALLTGAGLMILPSGVLAEWTFNNILNLLERTKKVVVYFSPAGECKSLRQFADVIPLLEHCPDFNPHRGLRLQSYPEMVMSLG